MDARRIDLNPISDTFKKTVFKSSILNFTLPDGSNLAIMTMETVLSMAASQENPVSTDEDSQSKGSPPSSEGEGSAAIQASGDYNKNREPKVIRITPLSLRKAVLGETESEKQTTSSSSDEDEDDEDGKYLHICFSRRTYVT